MEKKNNYFTGLHFFIRSMLRKTKESENCCEKNGTAVYGNDRLTKVPNEATQAVR